MSFYHTFRKCEDHVYGKKTKALLLFAGLAGVYVHSPVVREDDLARLGS